MLVKDIELIPAISDLVDNSIDGARRLSGNDRYDGRWVRLELSECEFRISDNCGGIPVDVAVNYAFRFGRPEKMTATPHSVGQFGVGMKRALFKLGGRFVIASATESSRFTLDVEVEKWRKKEDEWEFKFKTFDDNVAVPDDERGTTIAVTELHPSVSKDFGLATFLGRLREELERKHQQTMDRGLGISVNGVPLAVNVVDLLQSEDLRPAFAELSFNHSADPVVAQVWAGISASVPRDAGWYIFCNGRLVLGPDQSEVTGWGEGDGRIIPKYHNQFARFRGYVFFDSDDSARLPWNTTKTGVDLDADIYRTTRQKMLVLMRPVINFLNRLDAEKETTGDDNGPLEESVAAAAPARLSDIAGESTFGAPAVAPKPKVPKPGNILYAKPRAEIERVKKALGVTTYRDVGIGTFDYFVAAELEDEA